MTLPSVESTPEVPHSHVARVEEYHWFFVQFQHFSAPKYQINVLFSQVHF